MTTPDWSTGSDYTWVGPTTGGVWTDVSNWQYDGEPATHVPDTQTGGTITIPAGATVTIPSTVSSLGYLTLDVQGTLVVPSTDSQLTFSKLVVENGGQATISRTLNINGGLQINNRGTATFEGVTQDWTNPSVNLTLQQGGARSILINPILYWGTSIRAAALAHSTLRVGLLSAQPAIPQICLAPSMLPAPALRIPAPLPAHPRSR